MEIKRKGFWSVVTLLLAALSIWAVMRGSGIPPGELLEGIRGASLPALAGAVLCMLGFIFFEGMAVISILRRAGYRKTPRSGFLYGAADTYFSAITPSASGGQPASAFFMIQDGVPAVVAAATLLVNLVMYNAAIVSLGIICILINPRVFLHYQPVNRLLIVAGFVVLAVMGVFFFLLLWKRRWLQKAAEAVIGFLSRHRLVKHPEKWLGKLEKAMAEYGECVRLFAGGKKMWVLAYLFNLLQRLSLFGVTIFSCMAIDTQKVSLPTLLVSQCFVSLGANCVPIPGSMGVTDYLMLDGYMNLMEKNQAFRLQMLSRGLSFYFCMLLSGLYVLVVYLYRRRKRPK